MYMYRALLPTYTPSRSLPSEGRFLPRPGSGMISLTAERGNCLPSKTPRLGRPLPEKILQFPAPPPSAFLQSQKVCDGIEEHVLGIPTLPIRFPISLHSVICRARADSTSRAIQSHLFFPHFLPCASHQSHSRYSQHQPREKKGVGG